MHSVSLLTSRGDRDLSGSAQRTRLQIQERLRMTKQLAHLHDGEQGLVRGGLARQARKAWRIGSQAVGVEVDGTGAWLRRSRSTGNFEFGFVCAVPATWQCYPHSTSVTWQYAKRYCPCTSSVTWQYTEHDCLHASFMTWLHAPRSACSTSCDMRTC